MGILSHSEALERKVAATVRQRIWKYIWKHIWNKKRFMAQSQPLFLVELKKQLEKSCDSLGLS